MSDSNFNRDSNILGQVGSKFLQIAQHSNTTHSNCRRGALWEDLITNFRPTLQKAKANLKYQRQKTTKKIFALLVQQQRLECAVTSDKDIVKLKADNFFVPI